MSTQSNLLTAFNDHFIEFIDDIVRIFPDDNDLLTLKNFFVLIRKSNPRLIIKVFHTYVYNKYHEQIEQNNIHFFIEKDYNDDLTNSDNSSKIIDSINRLRDPIRQMNESEKKKTIKYMQNLCKLCKLYHS